MLDSHCKYTCDETVFDVITEESAYWIGFLMADGYISKPKEGKGNPTLALKLQSGDLKHIYKFRYFLKSDHPITDDNQGLAKRIRINSKQISESLSNYGIVNKKSLIAKVKLLELDRDFWRGVVDGDGTIGIREKITWYKTTPHKYIYPYFILIGSEKLMIQFKLFAEYYLVNLNVIKIRNKNLYRVGCVGKPAEILTDLLYSNSNIYLDRKMKIAECIKEKGFGKILPFDYSTSPEKTIESLLKIAKENVNDA